MTTAAMSAKELVSRLRRHYIKPGDRMAGGIFLPEVTLGRAGGSRADALYVGFTSTRGQRLVGHEIKVSRSDWQHELDQAGKADPWASQCHAWYAVAPSTEIIRPEELPDGWGLLVPSARSATRMDVIVRAAVHADREPSWNAMHSILKRQDTLAGTVINEALQAERQQQAERIRELERAAAVRQPARYEHTAQLLEQHQALVAQLAEALGMTNGFTADPPQWLWEQSPLTTAELRDAFATYLATEMHGRRALAQRVRGFEYAEQSLKDALKGVREARTAVAAATGSVDAA